MVTLPYLRLVKTNIKKDSNVSKLGKIRRVSHDCRLQESRAGSMIGV